MKTLAALAPLAALSLLTLTGCTQEVAADSGAEEAVAEEGLTGAPSNYGYFVVTRRDLRKCVSPMCGGLFVKRVNEATTLCGDGVRRAECYVSTIQLTGVGLSAREEAEFRASLEGGKALVHAATYKQKWNGTVLGLLKANQAWVGATGSDPSGTFYRAADNGVRCIQAPCPSTSVFTLNGSAARSVVRVDLGATATPAAADLLAAAERAVGTPEGVLLAGSVLLPSCAKGAPTCGPFATATEFYVRVTHSEGAACGGRIQTACGAGQYCAWTAAGICGMADATGTCSYRPELCPTIFQPVCGCDGQTYASTCNAASVGVSVAKDGACP